MLWDLLDTGGVPEIWRIPKCFEDSYDPGLSHVLSEKKRKEKKKERISICSARSISPTQSFLKKKKRLGSFLARGQVCDI